MTNQLGRKLAGKRVECGLTQGQAAELMGVDVKTLIDLEKGRMPLSQAQLRAFVALFRERIAA